MWDVCGCVWVCMDVQGCVQMSMGVRSVCGYEWVCPAVCGCARVSAGACGYVWNEFSEYLLET